MTAGVSLTAGQFALCITPHQEEDILQFIQSSHAIQ